MENILCPFCNGEISADAKKCQHCGEWVNKDAENLPDELKHFNWGAFLFNWIWGIWHKKYITLVYFPACLIPVIGPLAVSIWFGLAGNRWGWNSKNWESVEQFNESQQNWVRLWLILAITGIIISFKIIAVVVFISNLEV